MALVFATSGEARAAMGLLNKLLGRPWKGVALTPGPITVSDTPGVGWGRAAARAVVHPVDGRIALLPSQRVLNATQNTNLRRRLTQQERTDLDALVASAVALTSDWRSPGPEGDAVLTRTTV